MDSLRNKIPTRKYHVAEIDYHQGTDKSEEQVFIRESLLRKKVYWNLVFDFWILFILYIMFFIL